MFPSFRIISGGQLAADTPFISNDLAGMIPSSGYTPISPAQAVEMIQLPDPRNSLIGEDCFAAESEQ
jgi:hypothetical protein